MPQSIKNDPRLFTDAVDIRFSRQLNSCKVPQIRYATPDRLLERLTDLRFLSIDFLNTFLLTYRVFCDGVSVLEALKKVYINPDFLEEDDDQDDNSSPDCVTSPTADLLRFGSWGGQEMEGYCNKIGSPHWRWSYKRFEEEMRQQAEQVTLSRQQSKDSAEVVQGTSASSNEETKDSNEEADGEKDSDFSPRANTAETKSPKEDQDSKPVSQSQDLHSKANDEGQQIKPSKLEACQESSFTNTDQPQTSSTEKGSPNLGQGKTGAVLKPTNDVGSFDSSDLNSRRRKSQSGGKLETSSSLKANMRKGSHTSAKHSVLRHVTSADEKNNRYESDEDDVDVSFNGHKRRKASDSRSSIHSGYLTSRFGRQKRPSCESDITTFTGLSCTPRSSFQISTARSSFQVSESPQHSLPRVLTGVVITSSRQSQRRCSSASAAAAFAVATAGSSNPRDVPNSIPHALGGRLSLATPSEASRRQSFKERSGRQDSVIVYTAATMRVLNVLRHWISKHSQDFECDLRLRSLTIEFLHEIVCNPTLSQPENKAASQLLRLLTKDDTSRVKVDLTILLTPPLKPSQDTVETLSALELAEQMTFIDHQIFISINSEELLKTAWSKPDRKEKAPLILLFTKRFNEMSQLVISEVLRVNNLMKRVAVIEKWIAVADICRCLRNYYGVFQITSAFSNNSLFRLKKTWDKLSKNARQTYDKLKALSGSENRFRLLRDLLQSCDPPCIPYLGMYLTDLTILEDSTPTYMEEGLLNFAKCRMIAHVIREIRRLQQGSYKIEQIPRVTEYLLDASRLIPENELDRYSMNLEPRRSTLTPATAPSQSMLTSLHIKHEKQQKKHD